MGHALPRSITCTASATTGPHPAGTSAAASSRPHLQLAKLTMVWSSRCLLFTGSRRVCTRLSTARAPTRKRPTPRRSTCTCAPPPQAQSPRPEPPHARRYAQRNPRLRYSVRQDLPCALIPPCVSRLPGAGGGAAISRERLPAAGFGAGTDALAFLRAHFAHDSRPGARTRQPARVGFASAVPVRHRWNVRPFRAKQLRGCNSRRALTW